MITKYNLDCSIDWDNIVKSFENYDVYYLSGYVKPFKKNGDGEPFLLYYESYNIKGIYVFMKRNTPIKDIYDSVTPYGYGGWLIEGSVNQKSLNRLWNEYFEFMRKENIVDNFVRYHPQLLNSNLLRENSNIIDIGHTIEINLSSPEIIWENIIGKCRNKIRKAEKNGVAIHHGKNISLFSEFEKIYNETMSRDKADNYYYFDKEFYEEIHKNMTDNYEMFYATVDGKIIAMAIMLYANKRMHYHLSGSLTEYRNIAPVNLLLYKSALWGNEQGFKTLHLGGGVGGKENDLYKFKASFNKTSSIIFSIGKEIFNDKDYNKLVEIRKNSDPSFNPESSYFPLYRS